MLLRVCFAPGAAALARENIKGADTSINTGSWPGKLLVMGIYSYPFVSSNSVKNQHINKYFVCLVLAYFSYPQNGI